MQAGQTCVQPAVSVVVPTRGRADILPTALAALLAQEATTEVVVVVDGPDPDTTAVLRRMSKSDQRVRVGVTGPLGAGRSGGRRAGAELARGDVLLFVDDDVVAEPGLVAGHAARHAGSARRIVLGYMPVRRGPLRLHHDVPVALYDEAYEQTCSLFDQDPSNVLLNFWGSNFSIRREDVLRVGLFEAAFTAAYHVDRDFGLRCRSARLEPVFDRSLRTQTRRP